jgi:hypothetical protein
VSEKPTNDLKWSFESRKPVELDLPSDEQAMYFLPRQLGFGVYDNHDDSGWVPRRRALSAPAWLVFGVISAPWLLIIRVRRRRWRIRFRRAHGLCVHCGYDLRASTDRCPECGTTTAATN